MISTLPGARLGEFCSTGHQTWWILLYRAPDLVNYSLPFTGFSEFYSTGLRTWRILLFRAPDLVNFTLPGTGLSEFYSTGHRTRWILLYQAPDMVNSTLSGNRRFEFYSTGHSAWWIIIYRAPDVMNSTVPSTWWVNFTFPNTRRGEFYSLKSQNKEMGACKLFRVSNLHVPNMIYLHLKNVFVSVNIKSHKFLNIRRFHLTPQVI